MLVALFLASALSCRPPQEVPPDTDPHHWTFETSVEDWSLVLYDGASVNSQSELSWTESEGSPQVGCLKIVAPFTTTWQYVSVVAPIVADPFTAGIDLTGRKFSVRVRSEVPFGGGGGAVIFSNTGDGFNHGEGGLALLDDPSWKTLYLDFSQPASPYDPADMRFLGVIFATRDYDPADGDYTFYVDTCLIEDAP